MPMQPSAGGISGRHCELPEELSKVGEEKGCFLGGIDDLWLGIWKRKLAAHKELEADHHNTFKESVSGEDWMETGSWARYLSVSMVYWVIP